MHIVHFEVDDKFAPHFRESKYSWPVNETTVGRIKNSALIDVVTVKSGSSLTAITLKRLPALKGIMARTVGVNNIDLDYCRQKQIAVYHIPDYGSFAIAEHVFALILAKARKIIDLQVDIRQGKFQYTKGQGFTLQHKIIGIIGVGKIGKEVAKIARGFQMRVLGFDVKKDRAFALRTGLKYVDLDTLLAQSDLISLNVNLNPDTLHLINETSIKKMKTGVVLINVSRGEVIDTQALLKQIHRFRFVGLDVIEGENQFGKNNQLLKYDNILITPHVAFFTDRTTTEIAAITNRNIQYFLDGKQTNRVV